MSKNQDNTRRRLNIIEGQVRGLKAMVENDKYCIDIIVQSNAIKKALSSFEDVIMENHLSTHCIEQVKKGQEKRAVAEIIKVYKLGKRI